MAYISVSGVGRTSLPSQPNTRSASVRTESHRGDRSGIREAKHHMLAGPHDGCVTETDDADTMRQPALDPHEQTNVVYSPVHFVHFPLDN
jgi:hypothetical protein